MTPHTHAHSMPGALGGYNGVSTQPAPAESPGRPFNPGPQVQSTQPQPVLFSVLATSWLTHVWHSTISESCETGMLKKLL